MKRNKRIKKLASILKASLKQFYSKKARKRRRLIMETGIAKSWAPRRDPKAEIERNMRLGRAWAMALDSKIVGLHEGARIEKDCGPECRCQHPGLKSAKHIKPVNHQHPAGCSTTAAPRNDDTSQSNHPPTTPQGRGLKEEALKSAELIANTRLLLRREDEPLSRALRVLRAHLIQLGSETAPGSIHSPLFLAHHSADLLAQEAHTSNGPSGQPTSGRKPEPFPKHAFPCPHCGHPMPPKQA